MKNAAYARLLAATADLIAITGGNSFRVSAYKNASRTVELYAGDIDEVIAAGEAHTLDGIGKGIASELDTLHKTGTLPVYDELRARLPEQILDLLRVQGLGPKKAKALYDELEVGSLDDLAAALKSGALSALRGFGKKTQENFGREIERLKRESGRTALPRALEAVAPILGFLGDLPEVERVELAGSARRRKHFVHDVDILASSRDPEPVMSAFVSMDDVLEVIAHGPTKSAVRVAGGLQVDLRVIEPEVFGAALHHFTGSKEHNIIMRGMAKKAGLKISEYGVTRQDDAEGTAPIACATEADVFATLGLPFIPPELREGTGEIDAALAGKLPELVNRGDIKGDLHMHTTASDGLDSVEAMALAARDLGYEYICITDHSGASTIANGLDTDRLLEHAEAVRKVDADLNGIRVLTGTEVNILPDGTLDYPDEVLDSLDYVVASVHSAMGQDQETMTARVIRAISSGHVHCIGHPTGRMFGRREAYAIDLTRVVEACRDHKVALEINASHGRLDLDYSAAKMAADAGVQLVINTDAHSARALPKIGLGISVARRAWLEPHHVLNTRAWDEILAWYQG